MKRLFTSLAIIAMIAPLFVACSGEELPASGDNSGVNYVPENPSSLTPGEHKSKLEDIAVEFINYFNPADTEEIIRVIASLGEYLEDFEVDYDYDYYATNLINEIRVGAKNMSISNFTNFATRATESIVIDINDPDMNILAGYKYEYKNREWIETKISDSHRTIIQWDDAVAELSWGNTKRQEWDIDCEDLGVVVYVPESINFTLKIGSVEHLSIDIQPNITNAKTLAPSVEVSLYGGYVLSSYFKANSKGLEAQKSIKKNGKTLLNGNAIVSINDMTDPDNWVYEYYDEEFDEYEQYLAPEWYFEENVKSGELRLDILNLSIVGAGDFKSLLEEIDEIYDSYDPWEGYRYNETIGKKQATEYCNLINKKAYLALIYNDTNEHIAQVTMQVTKYDCWDWYYDENWDWIEYEYTYYDVEPIILFPDGSKYAFETYFTERAFRNLIDTAEELAETFEDIFYDNY